jgi:hypothetical protein
MKLPEKKPPCHDGTQGHRFKLPSPRGNEYELVACSRCGIRWIFAMSQEEYLAQAMATGRLPNVS